MELGSDVLFTIIHHNFHFDRQLRLTLSGVVQMVETVKCSGVVVGMSVKVMQLVVINSPVSRKRS